MSTSDVLSISELQDAWPTLSPRERIEGFTLLAQPEAEEFFVTMDTADQLEWLQALPREQWQAWVRLLAPDDVVDLIQHARDDAERDALRNVLDESARRQVTALQKYDEDEAGGLMNPQFYRLRSDMRMDEALAYLRRQIRAPLNTAQFAYVLDNEQRLLGTVPFRELIAATPDKRVAEVMDPDVIALPEEMDQEEVGRVFARHDLGALPVVDAERHLKGIVTADDVLDVLHEEATEDMHKVGGMAALDKPYLQIGFGTMVRKRVGWLVVLFAGETFTATAMAFFEQELAKALVLSLFVPLIVSSGGNAGSQATTLIIRAMALGHVRLRDWMRAVRREALTGLAMGLVLAVIAVVRIAGWEIVYRQLKHKPLYGDHYMLLALTVAFSVAGVVMWGAMAGCLLPFVMRALRLDPASASAPFVATLVDVTGLVMYFTIASTLLRGTLL